MLANFSFPVPFTVDVKDVYAQANALNQHLRKEEGSNMCIHETTKSMLCFLEVFHQIMTGIVAW